MRDPRIILNEELSRAGIKQKDAYMIALDAGSSQVIVDEEYLSTLDYSEQIKKVALNLIVKFYTGKLFEEIEDNN
jgi:hypothetical protein